MDPVNTSVDTNKHLYGKLESIEHLHETKHANEAENGTFDRNNDLDDFLDLQKSPSNGLLDSYHENITPESDRSDFLVEKSSPLEDLIPQSNKSDGLISDVHTNESELHDFISGAHDVPKPFCGTDKLNLLSDHGINDQVEEFVPPVPPHNVKEKNTSLLDFDPLNEPAYDQDDFRSYTDASPVASTGIIEPVSILKETLPFESSAGLDPVKRDKETGDKFKEVIDDSPRTGTPDFLELDPEDLKPIDVKTESIKPAEVKPTEAKAETKPDTKPAEVKPVETKVEKVPEKVAEVKKQTGTIEYFQDKPEIGPKEIFSKYGLDIWFKPERLNPKVEAFIYWRDPKLSAIVFVSGLVLLLSMAYYSLISVVANTGLTILVLAMGFRIYKHVLQAVQKTDQGHPYSVFLEWDLKVPQEKVHELVDLVLMHINAYVSELRRLFLIENWMESVRFAVVLWVLTYVGSWFNGLTLVIIAFVSLFTLPKVYENNKVQIDQNLALVHAKLEELTNKIKDVLPALLRKKLPEKKE